MKTYSLVRRGSDGRKVVLFESNDQNEILLHFIHSLDFERLSGYIIHKLVLSGLDSYYFFGNHLFTAKVYIL